MRKSLQRKYFRGRRSKKSLGGGQLGVSYADNIGSRSALASVCTFIHWPLSYHDPRFKASGLTSSSLGFFAFTQSS